MFSLVTKTCDNYIIILSISYMFKLLKISISENLLEAEFYIYTMLKQHISSFIIEILT